MRAHPSTLANFTNSYAWNKVYDSGTDHVAKDLFQGLSGSLDQFLLDSWNSTLPTCDAVLVQNFSAPAQVRHTCMQMHILK